MLHRLPGPRPLLRRPARGPSSSSTTGYRALLRTPGARALVLSAGAGRLGGAMTGLGLLWLVHARTGSYAAAGLTCAAFAVGGAAAGPLVAGWAARRGSRVVLRLLAAAHAAAVALVLEAAQPGTARPVLALVGAAVGASLPPVAALSAARWSGLLAGEAGSLRRAFALESTSNEASFLVGPVLGSVLAAQWDPAAASTTALALVVGGSLAMSAGDSRPDRGGDPAAGRGPRTRLRPAALLVPVLVTTGIGCFFGSTQVGVVAVTTEHGMAAAAGYVYAAMGGTSMLAALWFGARRWRRSAERLLRADLALLALASLALPTSRSVPALVVAVALVGTFVSPAVVLVSARVVSAFPQEAVAPAFAWLATGSAVGLSAGAALAGAAADSGGGRWALGVSSAAVAVTALVVWPGAVLRTRPRQAPRRAAP
ncbi:putative MFS family arabinose efflux permease [Motilibacter peucedani]|uniref:Putative MFS family arabinose efflux permease n=1 Tax=Motilibacter peucedani TaxID=598650 RepID=A0A420XSJ7_9ACTN|nr:MFS transporter [Motilibacter peucedani]RKS77846.1 putative MFS family arabinose efflux permease [Motilibacter peucedani]